MKYKIDVNFETVDGEVALEFAARNGHLNIVKELLKAGACAYNEIEEDVCQFPVLDKLHYPNELSENHIEIIVEILKSHPLPIHIATSILDVPKRIVVMNRLLEIGICPDLQDSFGDTVLHTATFESDVSLLVEILKHGVNMEVKNNDQETPLTTAFMVEKPEYVKELRYAHTMNYFYNKVHYFRFDHS